MEFNMTITAPVIRYHGAKFRLAPWVLQHFPQRSRGTASRTECVSLSPACVDRVGQMGLDLCARA